MFIKIRSIKRITKMSTTKKQNNKIQKRYIFNKNKMKSNDIVIKKIYRRRIT